MTVAVERVESRYKAGNRMSIDLPSGRRWWQFWKPRRLKGTYTITAALGEK